MRNKVRWRLHPKQTLCYSGCVRDRCGHLLCFTTEAPLSRAAQGGTGDPRRGSRRICRLLHLAVSTVTAPHPQCFAHLRPWKTIPPLLFGSYCQIAFTNGPGHSLSFTLPWMFLYYQRLHAQYVFYFNNPWIFREWLRTGGGKTHIAHQVCFGNENSSDSKSTPPRAEFYSGYPFYTFEVFALFTPDNSTFSKEKTSLKQRANVSRYCRHQTRF